MNSNINTKKVLIITYYWPPSGGPGVQRVLKFVKYLAQEGWESIVLTVKDGEYPAIDNELIHEIPATCKVYKSNSIEFFSLFKKIVGKKKDKGLDTFILDKKNKGIIDKIARWVRINIFLPDGRVGWKFSAIKLGRKIIKKERPDVILSSSPPHSLQIIANQLSKESGLPWIADFRDPWTEAFWEKDQSRNLWAKAFNEKLEERILRNASAITTVSKGVKKVLRTHDKEKIYIISNGYDPTDFKKSMTKRNDKFTITYAGYLARSQCPVLFFKAISNLPTKVKDKLEIVLYGKQDNYFWELANQYKIEHLINNYGYITHSKVIIEMMKSDVLLLFIPKKHGKGILTGKLFEYLAAGKYILGFGDEKDDAALIIKKCQAGVMMDYNVDPTEILLFQWDQWNRGIPFEPNTNEVSKYSRQHLTKELIKLLECV